MDDLITSLGTEIEHFLTKKIPEISGNQVGIFGAGNLGAEVFEFLRDHGIANSVVFDDYLTEYSGFKGSKIFPVKEVRRLNSGVIVVASIKSRARMCESLKNNGFQGQIILLPGQDDRGYRSNCSHPIPDLARFHNLHLGQRAFIIGNGPSLTHTDPRRIRNGITFACNNIFLLDGFSPDYYAVEDFLVAEDRAETINALPYQKFFPNDLRKWLNNGYFFNAERSAEINWFSDDFSLLVPVNATVTYTLMQLAFYMGCDPVYLVGVDHSYRVCPDQFTATGNIFRSTTNDPNHFNPSYFGKGFRWHNPRVDRMELAYRHAETRFREEGRQLLNATDGGALEVFTRVSFEDVLMER